DLTPFVSAGLLGPGDVWVMRMSAFSVTPNSFTDHLLMNSYAPGGLVTNQNAGKFLLAVGGTGAGEIANFIKSNTATTIVVQGTFAVTPDATTEWVVIDYMPLGAYIGASLQTDGSLPQTGTGSITIGGTPFT